MSEERAIRAGEKALYSLKEARDILSSASNWGYFRSPEDGARVTKGWFKVIAPEKDEEWDK